MTTHEVSTSIEIYLDKQVQHDKLSPRVQKSVWDSKESTVGRTQGDKAELYCGLGTLYRKGLHLLLGGSGLPGFSTSTTRSQAY